MAEQWETSVKGAIQALADTLKGAAELKVVTQFIEPVAAGAGPTPAPPPAEGEAEEQIVGTVALKLISTIQFDADSISSVPVTRVGGAGLQVSTELYQIHEKNVQTAVDYRMRLFNSLLDAVKGQLR